MYTVDEKIKVKILFIFTKTCNNKNINNEVKFYFKSIFIVVILEKKTKMLLSKYYAQKTKVFFLHSITVSFFSNTELNYSGIF